MGKKMVMGNRFGFMGRKYLKDIGKKIKRKSIKRLQIYAMNLLDMK